MANVKLSQIVPASAPPASTDVLVGVQAPSTTPVDLLYTVAQVATTIAGLLPLFSTTSVTAGVVPGSNNLGTAFFLRADGAWAIPPITTPAPPHFAVQYNDPLGTFAGSANFIFNGSHASLGNTAVIDPTGIPAILNLSETFTAGATSFCVGLELSPKYNNTGGSGGLFTLDIEPTYGGTANQTQFLGAYSQPNLSPLPVGGVAVQTELLFGYEAQPFVTAPNPALPSAQWPSVTIQASAFNGNVNLQGGSIAKAYDLAIGNLQIFDPGGSITERAAIKVFHIGNNLSTGTVTIGTSVGVDINDQSVSIGGSTLNYNLRSSGVSSINFLEGITRLGNAAVDSAPTDGDIWYDGTNLNFRKGAVTTNPFLLQIADQLLSGGVQITSLAQGAGSVTVDPGQRPQQYIPNTGAFTITAPANDGNMLLQVENGAGAGTITFTGFTVGSNTGDALDTVNGHKFVLSIWRIHGISSYAVKALQ